ncbi:MAG: hypothetical protein ACFE0Q_19390 [Anaerolineae bacterium]
MKNKHSSRSHLLRFVLAMVAYGVIVLLMPALVRAVGTDHPVRYALALLPLLPLIVAFNAYLWFMRQLDELQRLIQFEAVAISMAGTLFITLTLGFLEVADFPRVGIIWVPLIISATWGIGAWISSRRYA